jgi:Zn-dependent protease with chaperone function
MVRPGLIILMLVVSVPARAEVPVTGRDQHMRFSRAAVQAIAAKAYRVELTRLAHLGKLDLDKKILKRIRRISSQLIAQGILLKPAAAHWSWEIHLTSDPQVASYSMSGGKILVSSHFIKQYQLTDNELAVALAHEIGHVLAEHVREQMSLAASFEAPLPNQEVKAVDVVNSMESDIGLFFSLQPLSRLQELEADDIGIELAARSGVSPSAVKSFYKKIGRDSGGQSIFDTHGPSYQRTEFIKSMADFARPVYEASRKAQLPVYAFVNNANQVDEYE